MGTSGTINTAAPPPFAPPPYSFSFGDGSDGSADLNGVNTFSWCDLVGSVYTLNRVPHLVNLTIRAGKTLVAQSYGVWGTGTLLIEATGKLDNSGGNGDNGVADVGGTGGATVVPSEGEIFQYPFQAIGANGVAGAVTDGNIGNDAQQVSATQITTSSGAGGASGNGSAGSGQAGGVPGANTSVNFVRVSPTLIIEVFDGPRVIQSGQGGASGAGGAGDNSNPGGGGGGGGAGGGILGIFFDTINNLGTIQANGGNGGNGGTAAAGNAGGGGAGGGGTGGFIYIINRVAIAIGSILVNGGSGGTKGLKHGTGTDGVNGGSGGLGVVKRFQTSDQTWH